MTQFQFDMICKILESGAPALADELINSLDSLVKERNVLAAEVDKLNSAMAKCADAPSEEESQKD